MFFQTHTKKHEIKSTNQYFQLKNQQIKISGAQKIIKKIFNSKMKRQFVLCGNETNQSKQPNIKKN
jgi:hypothetical protein